MTTFRKLDAIRTRLKLQEVEGTCTVPGLLEAIDNAESMPLGLPGWTLDRAQWLYTIVVLWLAGRLLAGERLEVVEAD